MITINNFYDVVKEIKLNSLLKDISYLDEVQLEFKFKFDLLHNTTVEPVFTIFNIKNEFIITDNGSTYSNLKKMIIIDDPFFINITRNILREYNLYLKENNLNYQFINSISIMPQIWNYIKCISFFYLMEMFI